MKSASRIIANILGLAVLAGLFASPAQAQTTGFKANANARAFISRPLSFVNDNGLDFGIIFTTNAAGTVTVSETGVRTVTGGAIAGGGTPRQARFSGQGTSGQLVQISMVANVYSLTRVGGGGTPMTMNTFIIGSSPTVQLTTTPQVFTIVSASGAFQFGLGARLNVGANQASGTYQTTFAVNLVYQ